MYHHQQNKWYPKGVYSPISKLHSILAVANFTIYFAGDGTSIRMVLFKVYLHNSIKLSTNFHPFFSILKLLLHEFCFPSILRHMPRHALTVYRLIDA